MITSPSKRRKTSYNESLSSKKEQQPSRLLQQQVLEVFSPSTSDYKKGSSYAELMKMKTKNIRKSVSPLAKMNPVADKNAEIQKIYSDKEQVIQQETCNFDTEKTKPKSSQDAASKIWQIFNQESLLTSSSRKNSDKIDTNIRDKDSFVSTSAVVSSFASVDQSEIPQPRQPLSPFLRSVLNELPLKNSQSTSSEGGSSTKSIQNPEAQQIPISLSSPQKLDNLKKSFSNDSSLKHFKNSFKPSILCEQFSSNSSSPNNPLQSQTQQQPSKKVKFDFSPKKIDEQARIDMTISPMKKETTQAFKRSMEELFKLKDKSTISTEKREYEELLSLMKMEQQIISNDINYLIQQCNKYKQLIDNKNLENNSKPQESMISCISTTSFKKMISFLESTQHPTKTLIDLQSASDQEIDELIPSIKDKDGLIQTQRNAIARLFSSLKLRNTLLSQDENYV